MKNTKVDTCRASLVAAQKELEYTQLFGAVVDKDKEGVFRKLLSIRCREARDRMLTLDINLSPEKFRLDYGIAKEVYSEYSTLLALLDDPEKRVGEITKLMSEIDSEIKRLEKTAAKSDQY